MDETWKIAAILVADVVGYSRLTGIDEERSSRRLALSPTGGGSFRHLGRAAWRLSADRSRSFSPT
jgi:hypothetical protein